MARIVLTGAHGRVGRAFMEYFTDPGHQFALIARDPEKLGALAVSLRERGASAYVIPVDLAEDGAADTAIARSADAMGGIDVLVNNAAVFGFGIFADMAPYTIDRVLDVNLRAVLQLSRASLPFLSASTQAALINIASIAGISPLAEAPVYSASKAALIAFGRALRAEASTLGIAVCTIIPGQLRLGNDRCTDGLEPSTVAEAIAAIIRDPSPSRWKADVLLEGTA